jgi:site-specific recombinase XerD
MLALGIKIEVVQEILGHVDIRTTRGYTQVASEMARDATERMGTALLKSGMLPELHP